MHGRTYLKMYRIVPTCSWSFAQKQVKVGGWSKKEAGEKILNLNYQETKFLQFKSGDWFYNFYSTFTPVHHKLKIKYM